MTCPQPIVDCLTRLATLVASEELPCRAAAKNTSQGEMPNPKLGFNFAIYSGSDRIFLIRSYLATYGTYIFIGIESIAK